ncbi:hypothetical protein [Spiroplasma endosymbiont of Polydrusus pterygomalis]|uniref:hypothetical protein n=1 Tax=Spiroplasma endosymbiont of Polydrusus pterygomalis TaxID=3139327 RepID=UPI003CCB6D31
MFRKLKNLFCRKKTENKNVSCRNCRINYPNKCPSCSLKKEGEKNQFTDKK